MEPILRQLSADDLPAVQRILYLAISWNDLEEVPPLEVAMQHRALALYHEGWGRLGDRGCVAELEGQFLGGAFYRTFTDELHGDGYISGDVPEVAIAVASDSRGRGLGTRLMQHLADMARSDGVAELSLSVHKPNPARRLYERLGYETIEDHGSSVVMVVDLANG